MSRSLAILLGVAFAVSVVHYTDNYVNYDAYPVSETLPNPSAGLVAFGWCFFTAFGAAAVVALLRGRTEAAAACLAVYSGSGLIGIGHYTVAGATDMVWWRQAHIVADIACGVALFVAAARMFRASGAGEAARSGG